MARWSALPLVFLAILGCASAQEPIVVPPTRSVRMPAEQDRNTSHEILLGNCGEIAMGDVLFIRNQSLVREGRILEIDGEAVRILEGDALHAPHVGYRLFPNEDIDLELSFALVNDELLLHWRETFRHRSFHQGLVRIVGVELVEVCRGRGGADSAPPFAH